jgi:hypothetical protein
LGVLDLPNGPAFHNGAVGDVLGKGHVLDVQ